MACVRTAYSSDQVSDSLRDLLSHWSDQRNATSLQQSEESRARVSVSHVQCAVRLRLCCFASLRTNPLERPTAAECLVSQNAQERREVIVLLLRVHIVSHSFLLICLLLSPSPASSLLRQFPHQRSFASDSHPAAFPSGAHPSRRPPDGLAHGERLGVEQRARQR